MNSLTGLDDLAYLDSGESLELLLSLEFRWIEGVQFLPEAPEAAKHMSTHSGYTLEQMNNYLSGSIEAAELALPCEDAELRDAYLSIAKTWKGLAEKIERELRAKERRERRPS